MTIERREHSGATVRVEARAEGESGMPKIVGYAAVFHREGNPGTEYRLYEDITECLAPGCFDQTLSEKDDCCALINHDVRQIIGRASAGTLRLSVDATGLRYEVDPPHTQAAIDLVESIRRGDITGSSFAFVARSRTYSQRADGSYLMTLNNVILSDVSPVTRAAYGAAKTGLRSVDDPILRAELDAWKASQVVPPVSLDWEAHRARSVAVELAVEAARASL